MQQISLESAINQIRATRAGARDLFSMPEDVLKHLEAAGIISFDEDGQAAVTDIARGIFNEGCLITHQSLILAEAARMIALGSSQKILTIIEFLKAHLPEDVLSILVAEFAELGAFYETAAPILTRPIGSQPKGVQ